MGVKKDIAIGVRYVKTGVSKVASITIFLAIWEFLPRAGFYPEFLPSFSKVVAILGQMILSGELLPHIAISLQRSFTGLGLGLLIAVPLGLAMGWYKRFARVVDPLLQILRQTSSIALLPVFIILLGIGELSKIAIILWAVNWPILLNTISGVKGVDPILVKAAISMGASDGTVFKKVVLPSAIPSIMTGIRLGATASVLLLVAAEMIGAKSGLGFLITSFQYNFEIPKMYATILTISLLGLALNYALVWLEKKATRWKEG